MPPRSAVKVADGDRYRAIREELSVTQQAAAFHADIDSSKLCRFELGVAYLSAHQRQRLDRFLCAEAAKRHKQLTKVVASLGVQMAQTGRAGGRSLN
jgi:hypothetical protein